MSLCSPYVHQGITTSFGQTSRFRTESPWSKTSDRFNNGQVNTKLVNDAEWKLDLDLFIFAQKKYEKDRDACMCLAALPA